MTLDRANSLNTTEAITARQQALDSAHMQPLVAFVARLRASAPAVTVLACPHPSPLSFNGRPERRAEVLACLAQVVQSFAKQSCPLAP